MDDPSGQTRNREGQQESRALTGLRGLGALMVLAHHVFINLHIHLQFPPVEALLRRSFMGVDLFFVLSGFVMSMVYGPWFAQPCPGLDPGRVRHLLTFLVRRVARLWPLHITVVAIILAAGPSVFPVPSSSHIIIANVAMIQAWGISTEINAPAWSISVEMMAYLLFPLLAMPLLRPRAGPAVGILAVAALIATCLVYAPPLGPARRGYLDIYENYSLLPDLRGLAGFILGMVTWRAGQNPALRRYATNAWLGPASLAVVFALLLLRANSVAAYPLLALAVLGMHFGRGPLVRLFAQGPLYGIGIISYAVYLVHYALLMLFPMDPASLWLALPAYLAATFLLAVVAHHAIELPGRTALRLLGEHALARLLRAPPLRPRPPSPM